MSVFSQIHAVTFFLEGNNLSGLAECRLAPGHVTRFHIWVPYLLRYVERLALYVFRFFTLWFLGAVRDSAVRRGIAFFKVSDVSRINIFIMPLMLVLSFLIVAAAFFGEEEMGGELMWESFPTLLYSYFLLPTCTLDFRSLNSNM